MPTDDEREAYKRGRVAMRNLRKTRDFTWWVDYGQACAAARGEAMREAGTNQPIGKAYNFEHDRVMRREKLVDYTIEPYFPDKNTRKDAVAMVDNLDRPLDVRRLRGVLAWRAKLNPGEQVKLNHPTAVLRRWKKDTEPQADKDAARALKAMKEGPENPHLDALADTEGERDAARRHAEGLRELLGRVLNEVEDLHPDLREAITRALAE
jgi:hypothetical protein